MGDIYYDQSSFTQGQLDPQTQFRIDWEGYYKAVKNLNNFVSIPQGGARGRWGTVFVDKATVFTGDPLNCELSTLSYDNNAIYLLVWENRTLKIYLENILMTTVPVVTPYPQEAIKSIRPAQIENRIIVANENYPPAQLVRSADPANVITGADVPNNGLTITNNLTIGTIYPATFTTTVTLPVTSPQIYTTNTYFIKPYLANAVQIFPTATDAVNGTNLFTVTNAGVGVNTIFVQNTWTFSNVNFVFVPTFDFNGGYSAINFTPSATSGNITLTASAAIFTAAMIGGIFNGNGGIMRITGFTDNTHVTGYTVENFANTNAILGSLAILAEPAWSATRGYPRTVGFFQNRSVFGGSPSIPNGVWLSVVNEVFNLDDSQILDDDAISWYPSAGNGNYIYSMTSGRTLIVHTNSGNWSSALVEAAVTPKNFTLTEQNKFGVANIQPIFIDNQIMFVDSSGNNVINMIWEFSQNAFVTNNISVKSSNTIVSPVDMAAFAQPNATDGFYALFVNSTGNLASYQTLIEEGVGAWSIMNTVTTIMTDQNGRFDTLNSKFIRVTTAQGRCWFTILRTVPTQQAPVNIIGFNANNATLQAAAHGIAIGVPTLVNITAVVPVTNPQITSTNYYFAVAVDVNNFRLYLSKSDATSDVNRIAINSSGIGSTVISLPLQDQLYIEELNFNVFQDCCKVINRNAPATLFNGLSHLNGQVVSIKGDEYVLPSQAIINGQVTLPQNTTSGEFGIPFVPTFIPLPVSIPGAPGILYKQKHIRTLYVVYYNTVGATIQGGTIPVQTMQQVQLNQVPVPRSGVYVYTPAEGWDGFEFDIIIQQPNPLPITILALSYVIGV